MDQINQFIRIKEEEKKQRNEDQINRCKVKKGLGQGYSLNWDIWYKWAFPLRGTIGCHNQSSIRPNIYFQKHLYIFRQGFDWAPCGHAVDRCLDDLIFEVMLILERSFTVSALNLPLLCQFGIVFYACTLAYICFTWGYCFI